MLLHPVYVSLNGLNSVSQISHAIKRELKPILYSKGFKIAKKVLLGTIKIASKGAFDLNNDGQKDDLADLFDADGIFEILSKPNDFVKGNKLLIFDDLERCKVPTDSIFGFINNLVEHSQCKVIIIGDEEKLKALDEENNCKLKYKDIKEKLIGQTFSLQTDLKGVVNSIIANSKNDVLIANKELIYKLFIASGYNNIRVIKQCFSDFNRLLNQVKIPSKDKDKLSEFKKNIIAYFVIVYSEYKNGHTDIGKYFQNFTLYQDEHDKKKSAEYGNKYNGILGDYHLKGSIYSIKITDIEYFINNGFIHDIQSIINSSAILQIVGHYAWEELYNYIDLENTIFMEKLKNVRHEFYSGTIDYVSIVLHISGLLIHLNKIGLHKININFLVKRAKKQIADIYGKGNPNEENLTVGLYASSWGKQYMEHDSHEMNELIEYAQTLKQEYYEAKRIKYCKNTLENISEKDAKNLYSIFDTKLPSGYSTYNNSPIFYKINAQKCADKFAKLSNVAKDYLIMFLSNRYRLPNFRSGSLPDDVQKDKEALVDIKKELCKKVKSKALIDKLMTNSLIKTIGKCVEKIDN